MSRQVWLGALILIAWVAASSAALYYFNFRDYGEFDPQQRWLAADKALQLTDLGITSIDPGQMTLVHVRSPGCSCNTYVQAHITDLSGDFKQHTRTLATVTATGFTVPATPLALVFKGNQLYYAGPYASGPFCNSEDSLIADLLSGNVNLPGSYRNGLVKACRCLT